MDVDYNQGKSIAELPITHPSHAPCPDMTSGEAMSQEQIEQGLRGLAQCREVLRQQAGPKDGHKDKMQKWLLRVSVKANQLPNRTIIRPAPETLPE